MCKIQVGLWKLRIFSRKVGLLTRTASDESSELDDGSAMGPSSPLHRCSIERDGSGRHVLSPEIRAAVERRLSEIQQESSPPDEDESAAEVMNRAVERTALYFADRPPVDSAEADRILARFWKLEVRRRRRQQAQFEYTETSVETQVGFADANFSAVDAALDVNKILLGAPPAVRQALMMRYGSLDEWNEIAALTGTTADGIRKSCKRYLDRLRTKLGIRGGSK